MSARRPGVGRFYRTPTEDQLAGEAGETAAAEREYNAWLNARDAWPARNEMGAARCATCGKPLVGAAMACSSCEDDDVAWQQENER